MERKRALWRGVGSYLFVMAMMVTDAVSAACVPITGANPSYVTELNTLVSSGSSSSLPAGWSIAEGSAGDGLVVADNGTRLAAGMYSYGVTGSQERALGSIAAPGTAPMFGVCLKNDTGGAISSIHLGYRGQQWRLGALGRTDRLDLQFSTNATSLLTGVWIDVDAMDFGTLATGPLGRTDGTQFTQFITGYLPHGSNIPAGGTFWVRWRDLDVQGPEDALAVDAFTFDGISDGPMLSLQGVSVQEGNSGSKVATMLAKLTRAAGPGGVQFNVSVRDGSATAGSDYATSALQGAIPEGKTFATLKFTVFGDQDYENNEEAYVRLEEVTGANINYYKQEARLIIRNDDPKVYAINEVQRHGLRNEDSFYLGQRLRVGGIVTARTGNGFFMQTPDDARDAFDSTSEGIYVETGTAPPATATIGNQVIVQGLIQGFVPEHDRQSPERTQITGSPTITVLRTAQPLPEPIQLPLVDLNDSYNQLEKYEGMRITLGEVRVAGPSQGNVVEATATATSTGVYHVVQVDPSRLWPSFRESGIERPNRQPVGTESQQLPYWDTNPEVLAVDSDALGAPRRDLMTGTLLKGLAGILDYRDRRYTLLVSPAAHVTTEAASPVRSAPAPLLRSYTIANLNLGRLYNASNDPAINEPILTQAAYQRRLDKAALAIRNAMRLPDIIGVFGVEDYATLYALAGRVNQGEVAAGRVNPGYRPYLVEGVASDGLDIGLLARTASAPGTPARVKLRSLGQMGRTATWIDPGLGRAAALHDRPPLLLDAIVETDGNAPHAVSIIAAQLRDRNDMESEAVSGATSLGDRVRQKRLRQTQFLASQINGMQAADPARKIVLVADLDAFPVNDGHVDVLAHLLGDFHYDSDTSVPGDGDTSLDTRLVDPTPYGGSYPYTRIVRGTLERTGYVLVNPAIATSADMRLGFARINADVPAIHGNNPASQLRVSAHDPSVLSIAPKGIADLSLTATSTSGTSVGAGRPMGFTVNVRNSGPDSAQYVGIGIAFDAELPDLQVAHSTGHGVCSEPEIGAGTTTVVCMETVFGPGWTSEYAVTATAPTGRVGGTVRMVGAVDTASHDPNPSNDTATVAVSIAP